MITADKSGQWQINIFFKKDNLRLRESSYLYYQKEKNIFCFSDFFPFFYKEVNSWADLFLISRNEEDIIVSVVTKFILELANKPHSSE